MTMTSSGTTQIADLPVANSVGIVNNMGIHQQQQQQQPIKPMTDLVSNNIKNEITYNPTIETSNPNTSSNGSGNTSGNGSGTSNSINYNEIIGQIQHADKMGATRLPSRDIPQNPTTITMDENVKPNFIPDDIGAGRDAPDYIANYETPNDVLEKYDADEENRENLEILYRELQTPILLAVLYFLFNLPAVRKGLHRFIPNLFGSDGNPNLYGYAFNSIAFAALFFALNKFMAMSIGYNL